VFRGAEGGSGLTLRKRGSKIMLEFSEKLSDDELRAAFDAFLVSRPKGRR
jgi:hypothetical protein